MMKYIMKIFGLVIILLISACEHETLLTGEPDDPGDISEDKVRLEIFARANSYRLPSTRALGDENTVEMTPWVLVFRGSGTGAIFVEAVQAFEFAGKRYVLLTKRTDGSKYQLLILANPMTQFYYGNASTGYVFNDSQLTEKLIEGTTTLATACTNLLTEPASTSPARIPFSGVGETIPMSYLLEVDKVDNTTKIEKSDGSSLMLLRAVAKIVVVNEASNFELEGVSAVANVPRQGQLHNLIPASIMGNAGNLTNYQYDASCSLPLVSAETITNKQSTENSPIYIYETNTQTYSTYLIIQGIYETKSYYYKMAIVDKDLNYMNIYRNHAYTFTIKKVHGRGYDTVADAKLSKPSNTDLDFEITVDDSNSYEIIANNDYYLGVSNSVFIAYSPDDASTYEAFKVITDCEKAFPDARTITDNMAEADNSFALSSLADGKLPIVASTSPRVTPVSVLIQSWLMYSEVGQSFEGRDKVNAYITLKLGNLEKQVHIRRRAAIDAGGTILKYMPANSYPFPTTGEVDYHCLTGEVEDGTDNPKEWIKLLPSSMVDRNDTDKIIVEDGHIYIKIMPNTASTTRNGIVYLTTIMPGSLYTGESTVKRIKIDITQKGN